MKSVIAQGATVVKAVEEALKKAGMPEEFFVKLLEDAQAGFLGFGSKKAKIALFFKQQAPHYKNDGLLSQDSYQDLFDNDSMSKQIELQLKDLNIPSAKTPVKAQQPQQKPGQHQQQRQNTPKPSALRPQAPLQQKNTQQNSAPVKESKPQQQQQRPVVKQEPRQNVEKKNETTAPVDGVNQQQQRSNSHYRRKRRSEYHQKSESKGTTLSPDKIVVRPILPKNNDSSKS